MTPDAIIATIMALLIIVLLLACLKASHAPAAPAELHARPVADIPDLVAVTWPDAGPRCRICGCTDYSPWPKGVYWEAPDFCSQCAERQVPPT